MKKGQETVASKPVMEKPRPQRDGGGRAGAPSLAGWMFPAYLGMIFIGYMVLRLPSAMIAGSEMGLVRALFTAVNAATLTGFPQTIEIDKVYQPLGQGMIFVLILGGSIFSLVIGGTAVSRILRLGYSDGRILRAALAAEAAAIGLGAFFLLFDKERTLWQAVFLAASAFGNAGLFLGNAPWVMAWQTHLIVLPLITAGGLGICVLIELSEWLSGSKESLSGHANAVVGMTVWAYLGGTILLMALNNWAGESWRELILTSSAGAVGARTAGLGLASPGTMVRAAPWGVMILMALGGASGGTAGGIKSNSIVEIFRGVKSALRGGKPGRSLGIALSWVGIYFGLVMVAGLALLRLMPQTGPEKTVFLAVSAASNVGLSYEALSPDPIPAFVLSATMIVGRFAPLMILWWMADTTSDAELAAG